MLAINEFTQAVGFGLVSAAVIALASVGLTLQFGVTNFVNFAYGDFMTLGAYVTYSANVAGVPFLLAAGIGAVATACLAITSSLAVFAFFVRRRARMLTIVMVSLGLSLVVQNGMQLIWGPDVLHYGIEGTTALNIGPFLLTPIDLGIVATSVLLLIALHVVLKYTRFGKSLRATSNNPDLALVCGINTLRITNWVWVLSGFLAGVAGIGLVLEVGSLSTTSGFNQLFLIFAAVILGGIGRPYGAMAGALIMGLVLEVSSAYVNAGYNTALTFAVLVAVLLLRPSGLFSARGRTT